MIPVPPPPRKRRGCLFWGLLIAGSAILLLVLLLVAVVVYNRNNQGIVSPPNGSPLPTQPPVSPAGTTALVSKFWIQQGNNNRPVDIVMPPDVAPGERLPAVVVLHGLGGNPGQFMPQAGWYDAVAARRFIAVAPAGLNNSWNADGCCRPATLFGTDDVSFIDAVVTDLTHRPNVDPSRIYIVGVSNGAMMAFRYLCAHADRIAAAGAVIGSNIAGCQPSRPISVLEVAGRADLTVPYDGGNSVAGIIVASKPFPSMIGSTAAIAKTDGCSAEPAAATSPTASVTVQKWTGCRSGLEVQLVSLAGWDHDWPKAPTYDATRLLRHQVLSGTTWARRDREDGWAARPARDRLVCSTSTSRRSLSRLEPEASSPCSNRKVR